MRKYFLAALGLTAVFSVLPVAARAGEDWRVALWRERIDMYSNVVARYAELLPSHPGQLREMQYRACVLESRTFKAVRARALKDPVVSNALDRVMLLAQQFHEFNGCVTNGLWITREGQRSPPGWGPQWEEALQNFNQVVKSAGLWDEMSKRKKEGSKAKYDFLVCATAVVGTYTASNEMVRMRGELAATNFPAYYYIDKERLEWWSSTPPAGVKAYPIRSSEEMKTFITARARRWPNVPKKFADDLPEPENFMLPFEPPGADEIQ